MHLVYIDEVKYDPPTQKYHWLCALAFPDSAIQAIDRALHAIAERYFGTSVLDLSNEFHAKHVLHGKGPYKGRPMQERVDLFNALLDVIASASDVGRIEIRIEPERMISSDYKDKAFMFLVEKVDDYMRECGSIALLIADEDRELAGTNVTSLSSYRANGTRYAFGKDIRNIVDTIHHTRSHHSRLLQLADFYVYTLAMAAGDHSGYPRREIVAHAKDRGILFPTKYKNWPSGRSWYHVL
jgi:hypothetical protein